jgi:hypothetical protein
MLAQRTGIGSSLGEDETGAPRDKWFGPKIMNEMNTVLDYPSPQEGLDLAWFALRVRSNFERVAGVHLEERGYEQFSPTFTTERQWSDRKKRIEQHLFGGYVFCRFNVNQRLPILTVPGAVSLVSFGDGPAAIPDC